MPLPSPTTLQWLTQRLAQGPGPMAIVRAEAEKAGVSLTEITRALWSGAIVRRGGMVTLATPVAPLAATVVRVAPPVTGGASTPIAKASDPAALAAAPAVATPIAAPARTEPTVVISSAGEIFARRRAAADSARGSSQPGAGADGADAPGDAFSRRAAYVAQARAIGIGAGGQAPSGDLRADSIFAARSRQAELARVGSRAAAGPNDEDWPPRAA